MTDLGMWVRNMKVEHQRLCIANTAEDSSRWIPLGTWTCLLIPEHSMLPEET